MVDTGPALRGTLFSAADRQIEGLLTQPRFDTSLIEGLLFLDGNLVEGEPTALEYSLAGLERGAHSLRAQIVDAQGKAKMLSEPRMIHMRQNTASEPRAVGPNLRPRPAPRPGSN